MQDNDLVLESKFVDTSMDIEFARQLSDELNCRVDTSNDADFALLVASSMWETDSEADLAKLLEDQKTRADTFGDAELARRLFEEDEVGRYSENNQEDEIVEMDVDMARLLDGDENWESKVDTSENTQLALGLSPNGHIARNFDNGGKKYIQRKSQEASAKVLISPDFLLEESKTETNPNVIIPKLDSERLSILRQSGKRKKVINGSKEMNMPGNKSSEVEGRQIRVIWPEVTKDCCITNLEHPGKIEELGSLNISPSKEINSPGSKSSEVQGGQIPVIRPEVTKDCCITNLKHPGKIEELGSLKTSPESLQKNNKAMDFELNFFGNDSLANLEMLAPIVISESESISDLSTRVHSSPKIVSSQTVNSIKLEIGCVPDDDLIAKSLAMAMEKESKNDLEIAIQLEEALNKRPDTSHDEALAQALQISWDDDLVAVPDTSRDEEFARAIAKYFEDSIISSTSPLDSIFEEKTDSSSKFCKACHSPSNIDNKMRLGWIKEEKGPEDESETTMAIVNYMGAVNMTIESFRDHVVSQPCQRDQVEVIGSPCRLCSSCSGTNIISLAICSVIRRSKVTGKAINFDLTKQFVDVVTWLSTTLSTGTLPIKILYHWTKQENFESILDKNLVVPGNHGVRVVNGSALGVGIYASDSFTYARSYGVGAKQAVMVLGVLAPNKIPFGEDRRGERYSNWRKSDLRYCFFKSEFLLPLFLTSDHNRLKQENIAKVIIELLKKVRPVNEEKTSVIV